MFHHSSFRHHPSSVHICVLPFVSPRVYVRSERHRPSCPGCKPRQLAGGGWIPVDARLGPVALNSFPHVCCLSVSFDCNLLTPSLRATQTPFVALYATYTLHSRRYPRPLCLPSSSLRRMVFGNATDVHYKTYPCMPRIRWVIPYSTSFVNAKSFSICNMRIC